MMRYGVVFAAGGSAKRFGSNKLFERICGVPVFVRSLRAFLEIAAPEDMVIAANPAFEAELRTLLAEFLPDVPGIRIVPGGADRTHSVLNGVLALSPEVELAAVHDAARPLVSPRDILSTYEAAAKHGAAVLTRCVADTLKSVDAQGLLTAGPDRDLLRAVSTPQIFRSGLLKKALQAAAAANDSLTDDTAVVEKYTGVRAFPVPETSPNPKITVPADLILAEALLRV